MIADGHSTPDCAPTRMSTTCIVRKTSNAWELDIGTPAALSFFSGCFRAYMNASGLGSKLSMRRRTTDRYSYGLGFGYYYHGCPYY
jgi:hypothetical protein